MAGYKNGSIIISTISFILIIAGVILYYTGNERISLTGIKDNGNVEINTGTYKLYFIPAGTKKIENVNKVRYKAETNKKKELVHSLKALTDSGSIVIIGTDSKLTDKQKRELFNDLDFFIRNKKKEYSEVYSFTDTKGFAGLVIIIVFLLTFFSSLMHFINRKLVERDKEKFTKLKHDSTFLVSIIPDKNIVESDLFVFNDLIVKEQITKVRFMVRNGMKKKIFKGLEPNIEILGTEDNTSDRDILNKTAEWIKDLKGEIVVVESLLPENGKNVIPKILSLHRKNGNICTMLTCKIKKADKQNILLKRDKVNRITGFTDGSDPDIMKLRYIERISGIFCFKAEILSEYIKNHPDISDFRSITEKIIIDKNKTGSYMIEEDL